MSNFIQGRFDVLPPPITVLRLPTVKDAFTNASIPTLNYGDTHDLLTGLNYESFIGFDLSGLPEQEFIYSKLVLTPPRGAKPSEIPLEIHKLSSDQPWTETGITHANRPLDTSLLHTLVPEGTKVEVDLQGSLEKVYVLKSEELYRFFSKESGQGPYIEVAYLDYEAFREAEAKYFPIAFAASRVEDSGFCVSWEGTYPYGESKLKLAYGLSNLFSLSYVVEPRFVLDFASQARKDDDFTLAFAGAERSAANFALDFSAVGHGEDLFGFDFVAAEFEDFALHFDAQASSQDQFGLAFGAQASGESDFVVELEAVPNENFPLSFAAQGHEVLDITLEWEALQRYFNNLLLKWEAAEGGGEGAVPTVVLHESGCLKVLDAGVLIQGILITDTDDVLLEQVVLRRIEDPNGFRYDWKSHLGSK